jgi:hypothetical protein
MPSQAFCMSKDSKRLAVIPENTIAESAKLSYDIGILLPISISSSILTTKQSRLPAQFSRHIYLAVIGQRRHSNNNKLVTSSLQHISISAPIAVSPPSILAPWLIHTPIHSRAKRNSFSKRYSKFAAV